MLRISKLLEQLENKIETKFKKHKADIPKIIAMVILILYTYGMLINAVAKGEFMEWSPFKNIFAVFSPVGICVTFIIALFYCLLTKKGQSLISGYKTIKDKVRGIEILPEGTHGTSGWLAEKKMSERFDVGSVEELRTLLLGKLTEYNSRYVGLKELPGINKNILVYGAPGTGKSRGLVKPFIMQAVRRRESCILVDPKAEFFEAFSEYFRAEGYVVKAFNLLDMENSDGWNVLNDMLADRKLVQSVAEIIIRNTGNDADKQNFWEESEKNLLMALMLYVQTSTYPGSKKLLPIEERSIGAIYKMMSTTSFNSLDAMFRELPMGHPALAPYGIFKQAARQLWGNIAIGLGSRLNVFQNELIDKITKYNEIDLELPGKQPCAYFCIISDQDSSLEFLSSLFFSVLFVRLSDYARKHGPDRRLPVEVNCILDEFCNVGRLSDFKRTLSTARSRGISCQVIVQSVAQLADRYPKPEWEELVSDCDAQVFLGCNDLMTADFISKQCGDMTIRVNDATIPMQPLFSPVLHTTRPYSHMKKSAGRPLMMPDEVRRLPKNESIVLVRGEKPLKLFKITPEEHPDNAKLKNLRVNEYIPQWRKKEEAERVIKKKKSTDNVQLRIEDMTEISPVFKEQEELRLTEDETDLNPKKSIELGRPVDCSAVDEVDAEDI